MNGSDREPEGLGELPVPAYDPPRVERVLTPAELEREVHHRAFTGLTWRGRPSFEGRASGS